MGGGVGNALSSLVAYEGVNSKESMLHTIIILEDAINKRYINVCVENEITVLMAGKVDVGLEISKADIVIIHWWNHPAMASFLVSFPDVKSRVILWSHVNGCNYPCLPFEFLNLMDRVLFTTPFSYENTLWTNHQRELIKKNSSIIYGLGDYSNLLPISEIKKHKNEKFNIGYIGTLSKNKIHPNFIEYCHHVYLKVPNAFFIMVGDEAQMNILLSEANKYGIADRFEFTGYSNQIASELSRFDVFAYPLNPDHFGTTENVLIEAMASGIPVVALNHNTEKYIIGNGQNIGLLANDKSDYADCIKLLHDDEVLRKTISKNAKIYIQENFTFSKNINYFRGALQSVISVPKKIYNFKKVMGQKPYEWFLTFLGKDKNYFSDTIFSESLEIRNKSEEQVKKCRLILRESNKSSISHFSEYFPDDKYLKYWRGLVSE